MKDLNEYVKEFEGHLRYYDKSEATVEGYGLAIKMLLCDVLDNKDKKAIYTLKYTPETLKYKVQQAEQKIILEAIELYFEERIFVDGNKVRIFR